MNSAHTLAWLFSWNSRIGDNRIRIQVFAVCGCELREAKRVLTIRTIKSPETAACAYQLHASGATSSRWDGYIYLYREVGGYGDARSAQVQHLAVTVTGGMEVRSWRYDSTPSVSLIIPCAVSFGSSVFSIICLLIYVRFLISDLCVRSVFQLSAAWQWLNGFVEETREVGQVGTCTGKNIIIIIK